MTMPNPSNWRQSMMDTPLVKEVVLHDCTLQMTMKEYDAYMDAFSEALFTWAFEQHEFYGLLGY